MFKRVIKSMRGVRVTRGHWRIRVICLLVVAYLITHTLSLFLCVAYNHVYCTIHKYYLTDAICSRFANIHLFPLACRMEDQY